jgi:hypothetical protein
MLAKHGQSLPATEVPDSPFNGDEKAWFVDDTDAVDVRDRSAMQAGLPRRYSGCDAQAGIMPAWRAMPKERRAHPCIYPSYTEPLPAKYWRAQFHSFSRMTC